MNEFMTDRKSSLLAIKNAFNLTSASFSSIVLYEETNRDCLQHKEQHFPPSTEVTWSTFLQFSL